MPPKTQEEEAMLSKHGALVPGGSMLNERWETKVLTWIGQGQALHIHKEKVEDAAQMYHYYWYSGKIYRMCVSDKNDHRVIEARKCVITRLRTER